MSASAALRSRRHSAISSVVKTAFKAPITAREAGLERNWKNAQDQLAFSPSCSQCKTQMRLGNLPDAILNPEYPIRAYKPHQPGPKTSAGGAQSGLSMSS